MKRNEFNELLKNALKDRGIADYLEIVEEYEQHFAFKLRDGYSEEEIAQRLGDPTVIAQQYDKSNTEAKPKGKWLTLIGLGILDFFAVIFYTVLVCFGIGVAAFTGCLALGGVCLIGNVNIYHLIPSMPYPVAIVFGITLIALAVVTASSFVYYIALLKQLFRSYKRFHRNAVAFAKNKALLPSVPATPLVSPKMHRLFGKIRMVSFLIFVFLFVASFAVAIVTAGDFEFWHIWEWFGYER